MVFGLVWVAIALVILHYGAKYMTLLNFVVGCKENELEACIGVTAVYRVSFALATFHFLMFVLCLCKGEIVGAINEGAWPLKFAVVGGLFFLTWFIPNTFLSAYVYLAMIISVPFLVYEVILLIDLAYAWNKNWVENYSSAENSQSCWAIMLIVTTVVLYLVSIYVLIELLITYTSSWQVVVVIFTILAGVGYSGLSLSPIVSGGSLFTCGLVLLFSSFLCTTVVLSDPTLTSTGVVNTQTGIGMVFLFLTLFYVGGTTHDPGAREPEGAQKMMAGAGAKVMETHEEDHGVNEVPGDVTLPTALFHLLMVFASIYYSMLLTNWGVSLIDDKPYSEFAHPSFGLAGKLTALVLSTLLFTWSLVAPHCCPDRDFS